MGTRPDSSTRRAGGPTCGAGYALVGSRLDAGEDGPLDGVPDLAPEGRSVAVWQIESGHINGIDVAGRVVLTVSSRSLPDAGRAAVLLDEGANPEQALAITDAFHGRLDGPLACLAGQTSADMAFSQLVPVEYWTAGEERVAWVPQRVKLIARLESAPRPGPRRQTTGWRCRAQGRAVEVSVNLPEAGLIWHESGVGARIWAFHLVS
ncbi:MAG: DUF1326 domain-containing protein, partial [Acidimicrobiia bacterium]